MQLPRWRGKLLGQSLGVGGTVQLVAWRARVGTQRTRGAVRRRGRTSVRKRHTFGIKTSGQVHAAISDPRNIAHDCKVGCWRQRAELGRPEGNHGQGRYARGRFRGQSKPPLTSHQRQIFGFCRNLHDDARNENPLASGDIVGWQRATVGVRRSPEDSQEG